MRVVNQSAFCHECRHNVFEDKGTVRNFDYGSEFKYEIQCPFATCKWFPGSPNPPHHLTKESMKPKLQKLEIFLK